MTKTYGDVSSEFTLVSKLLRGLHWIAEYSSHSPDKIAVVRPFLSSSEASSQLRLKLCRVAGIEALENSGLTFTSREMDVYNIENYIKRGKTVILTLREGHEDTLSVRQWNDKDTLHLMSLMKEFLYEFGNPKRRKKDVWVDVSKKMQLTDSLLLWTSEDCRKKWSNMIRTFKTVEEQRSRDSTNNGNKKIKWPFYEQMLELLSLEGADCFPEAASVLASSREFSSSSSSVNGNGSSQQQEVYQNSGETSHHEIVQSSLGIEGIQNTGQGSQQQTVVEETDGTEQMQFYIVDNNPDGRSSGDEGTTVTFTASTEDFQTLATVAAAAASTSSANTIESSASLSLSSSDLKTNTLKEVKFPDQIISVPSTSSPSLLAIPADLSSANGLTTVVSIPLARYAGQLQSIQPRPLQEPTTTVSAVNVNRSSEVIEIHPDRTSSSLAPNSNSPMRGIRISPSPIRKSQGENAIKKRKISKCTQSSKKLNEDSIGDPLLDKFLAISNKQSERILEKIETFQQETLQIMRERNKLLENIFEFLKSQASDDGHSSGHSLNTEPV